MPKGCECLRSCASAAEDAFEAVVGAIYMDSSFEKAQKVVLSWYKRKLDDLPDLVSQQNPKGALQELAAKRGDKIVYKMLGQTGPDHSKVFEVEVEVGGKAYARASASSKKSAETKAARASLKDYAADCANAGGNGDLPAAPPSPAEGKTQPERKKPKAERQKKR